jgi:hypothetical protein
MASCAEESTSVGINMASFPGRTVWQKATVDPALLVTPIEVVASSQYGELGNGLLILPLSSQYRPPFWNIC